MGMFDYYHPRPAIICPLCGVTPIEWQGKDGPSALLIWEQGQSAPGGQRIDDDCKLAAHALLDFRLPARFEIHANCKCVTQLLAVGMTERGTWTRTELLSSANAVAYPHENEREFRKRMEALIRHPGHGCG